MAIGDSARTSAGALLGFGLEPTWGTGVTATSFMEYTSQNFKLTIESEKIESLGTGRAAVRQVRKNKSVEGTLAYNLHPVDAIPLIKQALMGTVTSAISTATAYTHTFTAGDLSTITEQGITFEVKPSSDTTTAFQFIGCRVNTWKLSANINEVIKSEMGFIGKDATTTAFATTTVAYSPVTPFVFHHGSFDVGGTTETVIGVEFNLENGLINDNNARSIGSQALTALPPGRRNITMTLTQRFDTLTSYDRFIQDTSGSVNLVFDTLQTVGSDELTYKMQLNLKNVRFNTGGPPEISEIGILTHEIELGVLGDTTTSSNTDIAITIVNSVTSY